MPMQIVADSLSSLYDWIGNSFSTKDIFNNLIAGAIPVVVIYFLKKASVVSHKRWTHWLLLGIRWRIAIAATIYVGLVYALLGANKVPVILIAFLIAYVAVGRHWPRLGLLASSRYADEGIGFESSLRLVDRSIDFLGIGARKLTQTKEFEAALLRCHSARSARFLLSPPDNPLLERMARRNGVSNAAYRDNVRESVRAIARIKRQKGVNIEVRFYKAEMDTDYQQFRMMFIDDKICLLSWTVWGAHIGTRDPQIVLKNNAEKENAFRAFHDYFERVWFSSARVDLEDVQWN